MLSLEIVLTPQTIAFAMLIFSLWVFNYAISTIRLVFVGRGMRVRSAVIANVVSEINDALNLFAYCLGAAGGSYVGMWLESKFIVSYSTVTVIVKDSGALIADALREGNYGVTVSKGEGRDGSVDIIRSTTTNKQIPLLISIVQSENPDAFIDIEASRTPTACWCA
ncbi:MAG: DUF2179 domain-containing protein, partial [Chloroflexota bacterium]